MDDDDARADGELLGFFMGPDESAAYPIRSLLPVSSGLTVLYGLNGAGKSRALAAIKEFFAGEDSAAWALVKLPQIDPERGFDVDVPSAWNWWRDWSIAGGHAPELREYEYVDEDDLRAALRRFFAATTQSDSTWADEFPDLIAKDRASGLLQEWEADPHLLVWAEGSRKRPRWRSAPAVITGDGRRYTNAAAELFERIVREESYDSAPVMSFSGIGRTAAGALVLVAGPHGGPSIEHEMFRAASHDRPIPLDVEYEDDAVDIEVATRNCFDLFVDGNPIELDGGSVGPSASVRALADELVARVNALYASVLLDAPTLELALSLGTFEPTTRWQVPNPNYWMSVGLNELSSAQIRWGTWAVRTALQDLYSLPRRAWLSIIDEPEAALHRSAEAHMASSLSRMADQEGRVFLLASHSPEILNSRGAYVIEVRRSDEQTDFTPLGTVDRQGMSDLGLLPSDLLRRQRAFLLVEGQHDLEVLRVLIGDELERLRVHILPLRGAKQLSAIQSRFLFQFTDAHVFVMLDNLRTDLVDDAWKEAKARFEVDGVDAAQQVLQSAFSRKDIESKSIREFLGACIEDGQIERVTPHGLSKGDIIEYLPVREFVPGHKSWDELRSDHEVAKTESSKFKDFKTWLGKVHSSDFSDAAIISAAQKVNTVPPDFVRLTKTIEAVTA